MSNAPGKYWAGEATAPLAARLKQRSNGIATTPVGGAILLFRSMNEFTLGAATFILSAAIVGLMTRYSRRVGVIAVPNHRSSHSVPTPLGGGGRTHDRRCSRPARRVITGFSGVPAFSPPRDPGSGSAGHQIGWWDDRGKSSMSARLGITSLLALAVAALVNHIAPLTGWINIACFAVFSLSWSILPHQHPVNFIVKI